MGALYACPAVRANPPPRPRESSGALLLGTAAPLLSVGTITHVGIFKVVLLNVKHSKYIQMLQFSIFWINL